MSLTIIPARESDLPAIKTLLAELLEVMSDTEGLDVAQAELNCQFYQACGFEEEAVLLEKQIEE